MAKAAARGTIPPKLDFTAPVVRETDDSALVAGDDREGERFVDLDLRDLNLTGSTFQDCEFAGVSFNGVQLRGSRFVDTLFSDPFAPVFLAARSTWRSVLIESPRLGSAELFESALNSVHILGGKIDYLNLRNATLTDVLFENCVITDLDLAGAKSTRVSLLNCRVGTLESANATNSSLDLRTTEFAAINGLDGLAGATIDDYQLSLLAPVMASHLGLVVE